MTIPYLGIGINKYPGRNALSVCVADAHLFASLFKAKPTLLDKQATRPNWLRALPDFASRCDKSNKWGVAHYSGHGSQEPSRTTTELDGMDELAVTVELDGVYDKEFKKLLAPRNVDGRMLIASDSCFSAGQYRGVSLGLESYRTAAKKRYLASSRLILGQTRPPLKDVQPIEIDGPAFKNVVFFAGCANFEYSWEGRRNGVWTEALVKSYDPSFTIKEWFAAAVRIVASGSFGKQQHPQLICSREAMNWGVPTS